MKPKVDRPRVWLTNRPAYNRGRYINPAWCGRRKQGLRWAYAFRVRVWCNRYGLRFVD